MFKRFSKPVLVALGLILAGPASAQTVNFCDGWWASARNIPEPIENHTRTFASGEIRATLLDTIEPASGAFHLMVLAPPYDELGSRNCAVISAGEGIGFGGIAFDQISASYDPASGLTLRLPIDEYATDNGGFEPAALYVTINQAEGTIVPYTLGD